MSDEPRDAPHRPPVDTDTPGQHRQHAHSATHGLLIAGRVAVALVAVVVLLVTGWEWSIKARADSGILSRSVNAIVSDDSNVATATGAAPPAGGFQAENILLLGSDTRSGANGDASNSDSSTSDGVANSDTLMIAHISADRQHVTVLSIPRDTWIDAPTCKQWDASTGQLSRHRLPGQPRRPVARELGVLGRRTAVHGAGRAGSHRPADRPGHRHRLLRLQEHGGRARRHHGQRLRTDRRPRTADRGGGRWRADHRRRAGAEPGPRPQRHRRHRFRPGPDPAATDRAVLDPAAGDERRARCSTRARSTPSCRPSCRTPSPTT